MAIKLLGDHNFRVEHSTILHNDAGYMSFSAAAMKAIEIARANPSETIILEHNGVLVKVEARDTVSTLEHRHRAEEDKAYEAYLQTPEGKADLEAQEQAKIDAQNAEVERKKIVAASPFKFTHDMKAITTMSVGYEDSVRAKVVVGLDWLEKHPGKDIEKEWDRAELGEAILKLDPTYSGSALATAMDTIKKVTELGWDTYVEQQKTAKGRQTR